MEPTSRTFEAIVAGDTESFETVISEQLVNEFAHVSGDLSPLHTDEAYAKDTPFGGRIAHGMLGGALFSRLLGTQLPGKSCLYLSQSLSFKKPVPLETRVVVRGEVIHKAEALRVLTIALSMKDAASGDVLTEGEAQVRML